MLDPTPQELKALRALRRLEKIWPKSLWIFAADSKLSILRKQPDGQRAVTTHGAVDSSFVVDTINIPSDGGDW